MSQFTSINTAVISDSAKELLEQQKTEWKMCKNGYDSLSTVEVKEFKFDGFSIKIQCNPGRIISTSAKVDSASIRERKCFLCKENLPADQKWMIYKSAYSILVNPFPIFNEHFTIPTVVHKLQRIKTSFEYLLDLSCDLGKYYMVFYNGPKCGASAPDHLHFQSGEKGFITIDDELPLLKEKFGRKVFQLPDLEFTAIDDSLRKYLVIESSVKDELIDLFKCFLDYYETQISYEEEPMMNILSSFDVQSNSWRIIIFLREKHRPSHFFAEGEKQFLLSPAAVDIGGVCILPRENDFNKISKEDIVDIFKEVFLSEEKFASVVEGLRRTFLNWKS